MTDQTVSISLIDKVVATKLKCDFDPFFQLSCLKIFKVCESCLMLTFFIDVPIDSSQVTNNTFLELFSFYETS